MDNYEYYFVMSRAVCIKIRKLCLEKNIQAKELAKRFRKSASTINRYVGPKVLPEEDIKAEWTPPSLSFIICAADVLGIDPAELFPNVPDGDSLRAVMWRFKRRLTAEENDPVKELKFFLQNLADNL